MADDNKPGANLSGGVIVAALATAGIYYFNHQAPLVDLRPAAVTGIEESAPQQVVARLWQDPIAAVEKSRGKSKKLGSTQPCDEEAHQNCFEPPTLAVANTQVLVVTVSGGPYQGDAEGRRRTRYAVLAGLERSGYFPKDERHIKWFLWKRRLTAVSQTSLPLLAPELVPFVLPGSLASRAPAVGAWKMGSIVPPGSPLSGAVAIPDVAAGADAPEPAIVPYERFEKDGTHEAIVLWIKEDALRDLPLQSFVSLKNLFTRGKPDPTVHMKVIGPFWSQTLQDMVTASKSAFQNSCDKDANKKAALESDWAPLEEVGFYSYGASASDGQLLKGVDCKTIQEYFKSFGIDVIRTLTTDDALADGLVGELNRRGINADEKKKDDGKDKEKGRDHVALISEWDTLYGRTLPGVVKCKLIRNETGCDPNHPNDYATPWIHNFTYLNGLDGLLPADNSKDTEKQDKPAEPEKQGGATDFFKVEKDTESLERPIGQSQFDYLRRISDELHKIDDRLRKKEDKKEDKIKAIGVLGGDIFDKLLILRALRPEFPEALFFTTDFDEAYTIKSELPYTRNLIISSSFGPNLSGWLQGGIPDFRDTYETSAFLATQMALGTTHADAERPDYASSSISDQLHAPRLFEVKRNGGMLSFPWVPKIEPNHGVEPDKMKTNDTPVPTAGTLTQGFSAGKWPCRSDDSCGNIQPVDSDELEKQSDSNPNSFVLDPKPVERLFPTFSAGGRKYLPLSFGFAAIATLFVWPWAPSKRRVELVLIALGLAAAALICLEWEPVARWLTSGITYDDGAGEPIALLDGTSLWPTVFLRGMGCILSGYLIWRALRDLHDNLESIATGMNLNPHPASRQDQFMLKNRDGMWTGDSQRSGSPSPGEEAWEHYIRRERLWPRIGWAALWTTLMVGVAFLVLIPMFGMPVYGHRSDFADHFYYWTVLLFWLSMQFLTFIVFDATWSCLRVVHKLSGETTWPPETLGAYDRRMSLSEVVLVHEWIDLDFLGKRTRCIGSLIYLPFIVIALLIVSRSSIFANYAPSATILASQLISLSVVFACAIMLWWAASSARDTARDKLKEVIVRLKNSNIYSAGQAESLLIRIDELKDGAFGPLRQQPLVIALLFPLSSAGSIALIENGMLPGL